MKNIFLTGLYWVCIICCACTSAHHANISKDTRSNNQQKGSMNKNNYLEQLMLKHDPLFDSVLQHRNDWNVQVIYTRIDRDKDNRPSFTEHYFNVDSNTYFYPASTVKLPVAILALQRLNELKISGLDKSTRMITGSDGDTQTGVTSDSSAADGQPSIAHYIKKILLVSDNDAFNRLYEFLGQEYINNTLHQMGYADVQILHRLEVSLTEEQNRHTNPVQFKDDRGGLVYEKPAAKSILLYAKRDDKVGNGYMKNGQLVNGPFDFSQKNRLSLQDLHSIEQSILFPENVPPQRRFNLTSEDYNFLRKYMSMRPSESAFPHYDSTEFGDTYVKNWMYSKTDKMEPGIRIFNKTGDAYGYLIDIAYIADFKNGIEFMLSGVIYCNHDGILNDNTYDYDTIGYPFFKALGRVIYEEELKRPRKFRPDLTSLQFDYSPATKK